MHTFSKGLLLAVTALCALCAGAPAVLGKDGGARVDLQCPVGGAVVDVDGEMVGKTPLGAIAVTPGRHSIRVRKPGYREFRGDVVTLSGVLTRVAADLVPVATASSAEVELEPLAPARRDDLELVPLANPELDLIALSPQQGAVKTADAATGAVATTGVARANDPPRPTNNADGVVAPSATTVPDASVVSAVSTTPVAPANSSVGNAEAGRPPWMPVSTPAYARYWLWGVPAGTAKRAARVEIEAVHPQAHSESAPCPNGVWQPGGSSVAY